MVGNGSGEGDAGVAVALSRAPAVMLRQGEPTDTHRLQETSFVPVSSREKYFC